MADSAADLATPADNFEIAPPGLGELFRAFLTMSLSGFGGVLPWARRLIVEQHRWMTPEEFNDAFALCQFLPGPNLVNFSVVFGARFRGAAGAAVALAGLIVPPVVIVILVAAVYARFGDIEVLRRMLIGVSAAAGGLILGMGAKMAEPLIRRGITPAPFILAAAFVAVGLFRVPLGYVLLVLVPISIGIAWWRPR